MSDLTLVGDELRLDGETVAVLVPGLAQGNSLAQIGEALGIAYKTVANTLSRIKEKLGVTRTADLIRIAIGRGLTDLR